MSAASVCVDGVRALWRGALPAKKAIHPMKLICTAALLAASLLPTREVAAQCSQWDPFTTVAGGYIDHVASLETFCGTRLFVAGSFTSIAGVPSAGFARWDGLTWTDVSVGERVTALGNWDDSLVVATTSAGNVSHLWMRSFDASLGSWQFSPPIVGKIRAFERVEEPGGPALYVGGDFQSFGSVAAKYAVKYTAAGGWQALGESPRSPVLDFQPFDEGAGVQIYAGEMGSVEKWTGIQWRDVGGTSIAEYRSLSVFDIGAGPQLWSVEFFDVHPAFSRVLRWDGAAWIVDANFTGLQLRELAVFDDGQGPMLHTVGEGNSTQRRRSPSGWSSFPANPGNSSAYADFFSACVMDDGHGPALWIGGTWGVGPAPGSWNALMPLRACVPSAPITFCQGQTTSEGCELSISHQGTPSASGPFSVALSGCSGQRSGGYFYGVSGPKPPYHPNAQVCMYGPFQRAGISNSAGTAGACDGVLQLDLAQFIATHPNALGQPAATGTMVWIQGWQRDVNSLGNGTVRYSNALRFTW